MNSEQEDKMRMESNETDFSTKSTKTEMSSSSKSKNKELNLVETFMKEVKIENDSFDEHQNPWFDGSEETDDMQKEVSDSEEDSASVISIPLKEHSAVETASRVFDEREYSPILLSGVYDERVYSPTPLTRSSQQTQKKKKKNKRSFVNKTEVAMGLISERLFSSKQDDPQDVYGKHIANKLRSFQGYQRTLAEKLINDVLFEAEMGTLTRDFRIVDCR